jgi:NAD(P)H-flavin reductase
LVSTELQLPQAAVELLDKADLFFISSSNHKSDMDTNHRGGPPGFVRIHRNDENSLVLVYPEYSGNRLYQTLGNLTTTPEAGLVFPDFNTGNVLYVTGRTEIFTGKAASSLIPHTNLAVKIDVQALRFVTDGLGFRGQEGEYSPYNPPVRYLSTEQRHGIESKEKEIHAKLMSKEMLTPTIGRFRFQLIDPEKSSRWRPGQYAALSFQDELDIGYSHMRDDDPKSLNDDFLRTFTVSSRQDAIHGDDQFEITIRKVGVVTDFLFKHNPRTELLVPLKGFGGEFFFKQAAGERISFIAGGVGITPVLSQVQDLDLARFRLYWTVRADDLELVLDSFQRIPGLAKSTELFVTGSVPTDSDEWKKLEASGSVLQKRRIVKDDLTNDPAVRWYLCTGPGLRNTVLGWLDGKTTLYEDFNY